MTLDQAIRRALASAEVTAMKRKTLLGAALRRARGGSVAFPRAAAFSLPDADDLAIDAALALPPDKAARSAIGGGGHSPHPTRHAF